MTENNDGFILEDADEIIENDPDLEPWIRLLTSEVPPVKLGNTNKSGKCGMCGTRVKKLYPRRVGQIDFMICERCKAIMDM